MIGIGAIIGLGMTGMGIAYMLPPLRNMITYGVNSVHPNTIPPYMDIAEARKRGLLTNEEYKDAMAKLGFNDEWSNIFLGVYKFHLTPEQVMSAFHRELDQVDGNKDWKDELTKQGFSDERAQRIIDLSYFIPSPSDVINLTTRYAFSPESREKYPQLFEPPTEAVEQAKKVGVTKKVLSYYWFSHFTQPDIFRLREMFYRKQIDEDEMKLALHYRGYSDWWVERILPIVYRYYTRVDIRRMNAMGVIKNEDLAETYEKYGYSPESAQNMADWTIKYNDKKPHHQRTEEEELVDELRGLTRARIVSSYKTKRIPREKASYYLKGIGLTDEVTNFYLDEADYKNSEDIEDTQIKIIRDKYLKGMFTENEALMALGKLDIPAKQIENYLDLWQIDREATPSQPSKKDLAEFYKKKIIELEEYKKEMENLGYNAKHIDWYTKSLGEGK